MHDTQLGLFFILALVCFFLIPIFIPQIGLPTFLVGAVNDEYREGTLLFVGDIMLGRHVEDLIEAHGLEYPFAATRELVSQADVSIGNFEGSIPKQHKRTEDFAFQFSIRSEYLEALRYAGFDILSLANNHAFDFGDEGYQHTRTSCSRASLSCPGHPYELNGASFSSVAVGDAKVGLVFLHGVSVDLGDVRFKELIEYASSETDIQYAFVHWGVEYEAKHAQSQEVLAHALVDAGIDGVIGHHPHVVQDIEYYLGKPIFYSLGNFVFDQYFSNAVQQGLALKVSIGKDAIEYTLIPVASTETKSQPRIMGHDEKKRFLMMIDVDEHFGSVTADSPKLSVAR